MNEWLNKILGFIKSKPEATPEEAISAVGNPPLPSGSRLSNIDLTGVNPEVAQLLRETIEANKALSAQVDSLNKVITDESKARTESTDAFKAQQEKQRLLQKDEWLKKHTTAGRIPKLNEDAKKKWSESYDKDAELAEFLITQIPAISETPTPQSQTTVVSAVKPTNPNQINIAAKAELAALANKG